MESLKGKLVAEAHRIEEDANHSSKGHFNAADRWASYHLRLGLSSAVIAAIASGSAFNDMPVLAGSLAIISTALMTTLTFLKPSERAENHKAIAGNYLALKNRARNFREIELEDGLSQEEAKKRLMELSKTRDELNQSSPGIPRRDYELAKKDIDEGRTQYRVDKEGT